MREEDTDEEGATVSANRSMFCRGADFRTYYCLSGTPPRRRPDGEKIKN